jgi:predicted RNA-binding protein with PUA-like domain
MRDGMQPGDRVLFYHSSAAPPAVAGTAVVVRGAYPDPTAWNPRDDHYDPKASPENPIWQMVDIRLDKIFEPSIPIGVLRGIRELADMELLRKGSRLSVQRVTPREFEIVVALAVSPRPLSGERHPAKQARLQNKSSQKASVKRR